MGITQKYKFLTGVTLEISEGYAECKLKNENRISAVNDSYLKNCTLFISYNSVRS